MSDTTQTNGLLQGITMPKAEDIYDAIMGKIELELLTTSLPTLDEKYKNETPEQKKARMERYAKAYAAFDAQYTEWITDLKKKFADYKRKALKIAEEKLKEHEAEKLANFDSLLDAA